MAKAAFGTYFLGDGVVRIESECERVGASSRAMLWSQRADVPDSSPNFLWRVAVVVWLKRGDCVAVAAALETLARNLAREKAVLNVYADAGSTLLRTYQSCRFDSMRRAAPPRDSRRDFEDDVTFLFTTSADAE